MSNRNLLWLILAAIILINWRSIRSTVMGFTS